MPCRDDLEEIIIAVLFIGYGILYRLIEGAEDIESCRKKGREHRSFTKGLEANPE
jgi:hypothetical protein